VGDLIPMTAKRAPDGLPFFDLTESEEARRARLGISEPAEKLFNFAEQAKTSRNFLAAAVSLRRAIGLCPQSALLWNGLGAVLWDLADCDGALAAFDHADRLGGQLSPYLYNNRGLVLASVKRYAEAEVCFQKALTIDPAFMAARWNTAILHMQQGDWTRGLAEYECRIQFRGEKLYPRLPYPMWDGKADLNGKTIFVHAEQGSGDRILFSRYLHWLHTTYPRARILYLCGTELESLLFGFRDFIEYIPSDVPCPKADYACFLMSLPLFAGARPDNVYPDPGLIRSNAERAGRFDLMPPRVPAIKVGIAWTGNPAMMRNHDRSIPFPMLMELEDNPLVQLYSLQFGHGSEQLYEYGADQIINDPTKVIGQKGYVGTAQALLSLDLVITPCTSLAHLAGAMNVPCWTLLCHDPYWLWLREGDTTPWYPNMRLFRQKTPGDWGPVIDDVKAALSIYAERKLAAKAA